MAHYPEQHKQMVLQTINRRNCTITEKDPTRAFSWLQGAITTFTFKNLLRHYAKQALTQFHVYLPWCQCPFSIVS